MLAKGALALLFGFVAFLGGMGVQEVCADPDECPELITDYSRNCADWSTDCSAFCYYPKCLDCTNARHRDHGRHRHCSTNSEGERSCRRHRDHTRHTYEKSPCIEWEWLYFEEPDGERTDSWTVGGPDTILSYGQLRPGAVPRSFCSIDGAGEYDIQEAGDVGVPVMKSWTLNRNGTQVPITPGPIVNRKAVENFDLLKDLVVRVWRSTESGSELVAFTGDPEGPRIDAVELIGDRHVRVRAVDPEGRVLQYRHWLHNGFVPSEEDVPYRWSSPEFMFPDEVGIYAFQSRAVNGDGKYSGGSNVGFQAVGMEAFGLAGGRLFAMKDVPTATFLPVVEGIVRPARPRITGINQVQLALDEVEVSVANISAGQVQYRWWPFDGFGAGDYARAVDADGNVVPGEYVDRWQNVSVAGGKFRAVLPGSPGYVWNEAKRFSGGQPLPLYVTFEVRVISPSGVLGDPSAPWTILLWGGTDWEW